jgi:hypothetical protein
VNSDDFLVFYRRGNCRFVKLDPDSATVVAR